MALGKFFHFWAICKGAIITQITPTFLQHCSSLNHMTTERLTLIAVHFYEVHRKVIPCTITCSVLFLHSSCMNLTSCSTDAPHGRSFSHTQKPHVTSELLCKEPTGILPQSILDTTWYRRSNMWWLFSTVKQWHRGGTWNWSKSRTCKWQNQNLS